MQNPECPRRCVVIHLITIPRWLAAIGRFNAENRRFVHPQNILNLHNNRGTKKMAQVWLYIKMESPNVLATREKI